MVRSTGIESAVIDRAPTSPFGEKVAGYPARCGPYSGQGGRHARRVQDQGTSPPKPDFELSDHGMLFLLRPLTQAAHTWVEEHIPDDTTWFADAIVVEHRYIGDIVRGAREAGLEGR